MPPLEVFRRLIAQITRTPLDKVTSGLKPSEIRQLAGATATRLTRMAILDGTLTCATPEAIREASLWFRERFENKNLFIVIDSLQVWARSAPLNLSEYDLVSLAVRNAREIALSLEGPILLISHRNRAGQERGGLFASKGSGDVEYAAETVMELSRDPKGRPNAAGDIATTLTVLKNRHGASGTKIQLQFSGRYQSFSEVGR
jgi:replicative DNA helicase